MRLVVLGVVVLAVLFEVAPLARGLDALGDLTAPVAFERRQLRLKLAQALGGHHVGGLSGHLSTSLLVTPERGRWRTRAACRTHDQWGRSAGLLLRSRCWGRWTAARRSAPPPPGRAAGWRAASRTRTDCRSGADGSRLR